MAPSIDWRNPELHGQKLEIARKLLDYLVQTTFYQFPDCFLKVQITFRQFPDYFLKFYFNLEIANKNTQSQHLICNIPNMQRKYPSSLYAKEISQFVHEFAQQRSNTPDEKEYDS